MSSNTTNRKTSSPISHFQVTKDTMTFITLPSTVKTTTSKPTTTTTTTTTTGKLNNYILTVYKNQIILSYV